MKKRITIPILLVIILVAVVFVVLSADRIGRNGEFYTFYRPSREIDYDIVEKIEEGIGMLKSSAPLVYETTSSDNESGSIVKKQIALAILNVVTGDVEEHRVWAKENEIEEAYKTGVVNIEMDEAYGDPDLEIKATWWNSFNTMYEIQNRSDLVVVANKYLVSRKYLPEQTYLTLIENGPDNKYTSMVYAPYSQQIHWPEVVQEGKDYLNKNIEDAFDDLRNSKVMSLAEPGELLSETVPVDLIRNIIMIEHIDPKLLSFADDGGRMLAERVLVILGANKEWAYRYTGSSAGAYGMAQFILPTYENIVETYPDAGLIEDYQLGMADHTNAIKAMALFLDSHKLYIEERINRNIEITDEMLSAVYNGGPARVISTVNDHGKNWHKSDLFPDETVNYVEKYKIISELDIFD